MKTIELSQQEQQATNGGQSMPPPPGSGETTTPWMDPEMASVGTSQDYGPQQTLDHNQRSETTDNTHYIR